MKTVVDLFFYRHAGPTDLKRHPLQKACSLRGRYSCKSCEFCESCFRRMRDRGGQAPALRHLKHPSFHRRARACPSPCINRDSKRPCLWGCGRFSFRRRDREGQAPALRSKRRSSFGSNVRGGQAPALRKQWRFRSGLKVCKTLMSIAPRDTMNLRSFRSLRCLDSLGCHFH